MQRALPRGMKPTPHLRWREATHSEELRQPCIAGLRSAPETRYVLEQLWKDAAERYEWRSVTMGSTQPNALETALLHDEKVESLTQTRDNQVGASPRQAAQISDLRGLLDAVANIRG